MRLTTKGRFAVTAMIDLALRCADGPVTLAGIADRQKISLSYLEQLFGKLRRFELVSSVRGPGGGYALAREMDSITVADIIAAVDEPLDATSCGGKENCHDEHRCMTHESMDQSQSADVRVPPFRDSGQLGRAAAPEGWPGVRVAR
jgi:Rrf2 family iron-sulfur cluster assembly transcriptional regulator